MKPVIAAFDKEAGGDIRDADMTLIRGAASGDRASQRRLVERVMPRVEKTVVYLARGKSDTDDLVQLALIQIVRSAGSFRGDSSLDFWTDRVVLQTLAKQFEKRHRRQRLRESVWEFPAGVPAPVDEQAELAEIRGRLRLLLGRLPDKLRVALVLFCVYGYTAPEIAALTDTKTNTVRGRLRLGLGRLKKDISADPVLREWAELGG
jgi:RNA polymerase sigma-70 factor, ECF subfamily